MIASTNRPCLHPEARALRQELRRRRVRLTLDADGGLHTDPPLRALPAALVGRIAEQADALRALLRRSRKRGS